MQMAHRPHLLEEVAAMLCGRKGKRCTELPMAHHGDVMATQGGALGGGGFQEAGDARGGGEFREAEGARCGSGVLKVIGT